MRENCRKLAEKKQKKIKHLASTLNNSYSWTKKQCLSNQPTNQPEQNIQIASSAPHVLPRLPLQVIIACTVDAASPLPTVRQNVKRRIGKIIVFHAKLGRKNKSGRHSPRCCTSTQDFSHPMQLRMKFFVESFLIMWIVILMHNFFDVSANFFKTSFDLHPLQNVSSCLSHVIFEHCRTQWAHGHQATVPNRLKFICHLVRTTSARTSCGSLALVSWKFVDC